ncbi:hypothetical protein HK104_010791 [Borealophlyctis nickersoniae]|nr:hypothetical protein HK104_010791 [Borealophlyctis nickersoniae]
MAAFTSSAGPTRLSADSAIITNLPQPRSYTRLVSLGKFLITYGGATTLIGNSTTPGAYDPNLYFFDTEKSEWISSTTFLNDPWFKSSSGSNGDDGGSANIGAIAGGVVAGIVVLIAAVAGVLVMRRRGVLVMRRRKVVKKADDVPAAGHGGVPPPPVMHGLHTPEYYV